MIQKAKYIFVFESHWTDLCIFVFLLFVWVCAHLCRRRPVSPTHGVGVLHASPVDKIQSQVTRAALSAGPTMPMHCNNRLNTYMFVYECDLERKIKLRQSRLLLTDVGARLKEV